MTTKRSPGDANPRRRKRLSSRERSAKSARPTTSNSQGLLHRLVRKREGAPFKLGLSGDSLAGEDRSQRPHSNVAKCAPLEWGTLSITFFGMLTSIWTLRAQLQEYSCAFSPPRRPLGLDLDDAHLSSCVMTETAPWPVFRFRNQATLDGIAMEVP